MFNKHFNLFIDMYWNKQFVGQVLHFNILTAFVVAKQHSNLAEKENVRPQACVYNHFTTPHPNRI